MIQRLPDVGVTSAVVDAVEEIKKGAPLGEKPFLFEVRRADAHLASKNPPRIWLIKPLLAIIETKLSDSLQNPLSTIYGITGDFGTKLF